MIILTYILIHAVCGLISCGYSFAFSQRAFPSLRKTSFERDKKFAQTDFLGGPIALVITLLCKDTLMAEGWLLPWSKKAKREAGLL